MNIAIIYDLDTKKSVGVVCCDYKTGDIAYFSKNLNLLDCLDILIDTPLYFIFDEKIGDMTVVKREQVNTFDSFYLLALNYNLPNPWKILNVENVKGDIESLIDQYSSQLEG